MNILCSDLFEKQIKVILEGFSKEDFEATKSFKLYLDTIILNIPTKARKYEKSVFFDDENIRDLLHENFILPFLIDEESDNFVILAIIEK